MRKLIIFGIALLLVITSVNAYEVLEELSDNELLNLEDNLDLDVSYGSYLINDDEIIFSFDIDDYKRRDGANLKIRRTFEAVLDVNILISCLEENDGNYCYDAYINGNELVIIENDQEETETAPIRMQLNEEITAIRNKVSNYQNEIRADRNPLRNFIEGLNLRNILG